MSESETIFGNIVLGGVALVLVMVAVAVVRNNFGRRYWLLWHSTKFLIGYAGFLVLLIVAASVGVRGWWVQYALVGLVPLFMAVAEYYLPEGFRRKAIPPRKIPMEIRNEVIRRYVAKGGIFDSTKQVDHKVPYCKGGGHTLDNLRVVPKHVNQKKGGKMPLIQDWFRIWRGKDDC